MTDPFLAEIRMFSGNFAPAGWALCNGQLLPVRQNTALFSLLGVTYGGDGKVTFALPNFQGATPVQQGQGPGLTWRALGEQGGQTQVTVQPSEMPSHTHLVNAVDSPGDSSQPGGATFAQARRGRAADKVYAAGQSPDVAMNPQTSGLAGSNQPHNNMPPYLGLTFIIALQGIFPQRP